MRPCGHSTDYREGAARGNIAGRSNTGGVGHGRNCNNRDIRCPEIDRHSAAGVVTRSDVEYTVIVQIAQSDSPGNGLRRKIYRTAETAGTIAEAHGYSVAAAVRH